MIHDEARILLGLKKVRLGKGYWNSVGGHVEDGEEVHEAAIREVFEEFGLIAHQVEKMGLLKIEGVLDEFIHIHVFKVREYSGGPSESDELKPKWFKLGEIPFHNMWPNDKHWLPIFLNGDKFIGDFTYENGKLIKQKVEITNNII